MSVVIEGFWGLVSIFFLIAFLYASAGFGGGSSYLAILALVLTGFFMIRSTALICNLVVVTGNCLLYYRKGHLQWKRFLPFIVTSIPLAFIGALIPLQERTFFIVLGLVLLLAAVFLTIQTYSKPWNDRPKSYPKGMAYIMGAVVGLLSGMVGIGGGIFLAPILHFMKWDRPIVIASLASFFILVNSVSGLSGLWLGGTLSLPWPEIIGLVLAVLIGGQLGVRYTLVKASPKRLRLLTAVLVLIVGIRILLKNGLQFSFM
ncbi:MAG: sulfite exporter TauE/SafE family protein [Flavobacteriaceae bacterium]|nr:sulfite exporter TauE/SafE family protein [Flavobacteriaceae bacterium]